MSKEFSEKEKAYYRTIHTLIENNSLGLKIVIRDAYMQYLKDRDLYVGQDTFIEFLDTISPSGRA